MDGRKYLIMAPKRTQQLFRRLSGPVLLRMQLSRFRNLRSFNLLSLKLLSNRMYCQTLLLRPRFALFFRALSGT